MGLRHLLSTRARIRVSNHIVFNHIVDGMSCSVTTPTDGFAAAFGNVVVYGCNHNFMLIGSMVSQCMENGQWAGHQPFCRGKIQ